MKNYLLKSLKAVHQHRPITPPGATRVSRVTDKITCRIALLLFGVIFTTGNASAQTAWHDYFTSNNSTVEQRHETGSVVHGNKLYVLGGRFDRPTQVFDASENTWSTLAPLPMELHHFQPVVVDDHIYVIGALKLSAPCLQTDNADQLAPLCATTASI